MEAKDSPQDSSHGADGAECLGRDETCPLCGGDNQCRVAKGHLYKGDCWCQHVAVPGHILKRLVNDGLSPVCLCRPCLETVAKLAREGGSTESIIAEVRKVVAARTPPQPDLEDFYIDADGNTVFTAAYHLKRGNCCDNGCRHCPY
jgi:hypothetical protein